MENRRKLIEKYHSSNYSFQIHEPAIFLPGVEWNAYDLQFQDLSSPVVKTTLSLGLNDVTVVSWWSDNNGDTMGGRAQWYSDICRPQACNICERQYNTAKDGWVRRIKLYEYKYYNRIYQNIISINVF